MQKAEFLEVGNTYLVDSVFCLLTSAFCLLT